MQPILRPGILKIKMDIMNEKDIKTRLDTLKVPEAVDPGGQKQLKFAVLSARKSARLSLWIMALPAIILLGAICDPLFHILLPPWSLMKEYGPHWPLWLRIAIFTGTVMVFPLIAVFVNLLSIIWFQYDRQQKVLSMSIRLKPVNLVIITIAGLLAALFIGHAIADSIAGHD